jgi:hypothetical protein
LNVPPERGRLSDADRDQLIELLSRHCAAGRFGTEELERRVAIVYEAETRDQVAAAIADLPPLGDDGGEGGEPPRRAGWGRGHAEANVPAAGWLPTDERFRDPTTRRVMRVWVDPVTGARHYVPDQPA